MYDEKLMELELQKAAAFYCEGLTIQEISEIVSQPLSEVQRMIQHAEQSGYFEYRPQLFPNRILPEVGAYIKDEVLTAALRRVLNESLELRLITLHIARSPASMFRLYEIEADESSVAHKKYREAELVSLKLCGSKAADHLCSKLFDDRDHTIGVNWGNAVKLTIDQIRPMPSTLRDGLLSVISLFGDLDFHPQQPLTGQKTFNHVNCNRHVQQLAMRLGSRSEAVSLSVPGFIPSHFAEDGATLEAIRSFLGSHASYQRIFGDLPGNDPVRPRAYNGIIDVDSDAHITKMDTIITGFGSADTYTDAFHYLSFWLSEEESQILRSHCREGRVVGDIAGHLVPSIKGEKDDVLMRFLRRINSRILAAQPSDFVDVACRHRKNGLGAGVVGVTVGARKAKILARLLSKSPAPVSALFIDTHLALSLLADLSPTEFGTYLRGAEGRLLVEDAKEWSAGTQTLIPALSHI
ncbi:hypothetical protein [Accumulibacter sp.]|uniref:hypothetical protein n=1 Tax=Accumulibacter sp. TaxID=2053492 RepID=UPI002617F6A6|nr:hypothetical protein [Accumulibacter sp.]